MNAPGQHDRPSPEVARYHALDALRAFAMFLGVGLHAAISFMVKPPGFWPVRDNDPSILADVALYAVHDFRMQLFFLLAGFFGCLLYRRYGAWGMARHRLMRVGVPFALGVVFIVPTVLAAVLYAEIGNVRAGEVRGEVSPVRAFAAELVAANPDASGPRLIADSFATGEWLARFAPVHLWFLYYLLILYSVALLLAPIFGRLSGTRFLAALDAGFRGVVTGPGRIAVPALVTFPLLLPMRSWTIDTPTNWVPAPHILGYYFWFFAVGWMLFRHRDLVAAFGRGWGPNLLVANLLVLPAALGMAVVGVMREGEGASATGLRLGSFAAAAVYTWLMIAGLWGVFLRRLDGGAAWSRYLADASYWCYLASITPVLLLQHAVRDWPLPGLLKLVLVTAATFALLLVSYEWCVRYTLIGAILNGRKRRGDRPPRAEQRPADAEGTYASNSQT